MVNFKITQVQNLPNTSETGKIYVTSSGLMYLGKSDNTFIQLAKDESDVKFVATLPSDNIEEDKLYALVTDGKLNLHVYDGTSFIELTAKDHTHVITDITDLQSILDNKLDAALLTVVSNQLNLHETSLLTSETGIHGVRLWENKIEQFETGTSTWVEFDLNSVVDGTLLTKGIVQLTNEIDEREDLAVTPKAVMDYLEGFEGSIKKEEFIFENLPQGTTQVEFTPVKVGKYFIEFLYVNTTKQKDDTYTITPKNQNDLSQGYTLTLSEGTLAVSSLFNLVLVSGVSVGKDDENNLKGIGDSQVRVTVPQDTLIIPINDVNYKKDTCSVLLFDNSTKVFGDEFTVETSSTSSSGYQIVFKQPVNSIENKIFEVVVIYGKTSSFVFGG